MPTKKTRLWTYSLPVALVLLAPFNILASLGMDIYLPIVPAMPAILGTTPEVVQLTLTLYMIMLGVGQIIFGPLLDRFGRRPILIGGVVSIRCNFIGTCDDHFSLAFRFTTTSTGCWGGRDAGGRFRNSARRLCGYSRQRSYL